MIEFEKVLIWLLKGR